MIINGLQKLTLLDFPGYTACTVFTLGCNMRCPFCQNKGLVVPNCFEKEAIIPEEDILCFLKERKSKLQGICITGGEPTLQTDLPEFIRKVKDIGYKVKLDTNGTRPGVIRQLLSENLLNYIAMDIKNDPDRYSMTAGTPVDINLIRETIDLIKNSGIEYELRTTVTQELHDEQSFRHITEMAGHITNYSLQYYEQTDTVINPVYSTPSDDSMASYKKIMETCTDSVIIKGR